MQKEIVRPSNLQASLPAADVPTSLAFSQACSAKCLARYVTALQVACCSHNGRPGAAKLIAQREKELNY
eukprot:149936-Pelagomonas_calceolata.AAC.1